MMLSSFNRKQIPRSSSWNATTVHTSSIWMNFGWIIILIGLYNYNTYHQTIYQVYSLHSQQPLKTRYHSHILQPATTIRHNLRQCHAYGYVFLLKNEMSSTGSTSSSSSSSNEINYLNDENLRATASTGTNPSSGIISTAVAAVSSSNTIRTAMPNKLPTIWSSRNDLFQMIRPNNIPGIVLFHMLGVYLVLVHATTIVAITSTTLGSNVIIPKYWNILLKEPVIWLTLISTNLVSATSMVVNDYYDAKLGRDTLKQHHHQLQQQLQQQRNVEVNSDNVRNSNDIATTVMMNDNSSSDTKWILHPVNGIWNKLVTRRLLMYLYSIALCISNCLPGIPTRISVNIALMMTYLYTVHFKPITLMKNIVCATLIALAPWTSGSCTLYLLQQQYNIHFIGTSILRGGVWAIPSLWRLFGVLFTGVLGREILMDCNDVVADRASGIRTIPVVYGCQMASYIATFTTGIMTYLAMALPLQQLLPLISSSLSSLSSSQSIAHVVTQIWMTSPFRRLVCAGLGCILQWNGMRKILQTNGSDKSIIDQMIQQNLYTVILLMASFI